MKKKFMYGLLLFFTVLFAGCSDDKGDPDDPDTWREIRLGYTVEADREDWDYVKFKMSNLPSDYMDDNESDWEEFKEFGKIALPDDLTIDWGDGTKNSQTFHYYEEEGEYRITVKAKNLKWFECGDGAGGCSSIDLSDCPGLIGLLVYGDYTSIDLSKCPQLKYIDVMGNNRSLDVSGHKDLIMLDCGESYELKNLDLEGCSALKRLYCYYSGFESLDISGFKNLEDLRCFNSERLERLNIAGCRSLKWLDCYSTHLSNLDVSDCRDLVYVDVENCVFQRKGLNALYESLPEGKTWEEDGGVYQSTIEIGGNFSEGNIEIAEDKGWQVKGAGTNPVNVEVKQKSKRVRFERR